jgi:hypothetical protein
MRKVLYGFLNKEGEVGKLYITHRGWIKNENFG